MRTFLAVDIDTNARTALGEAVGRIDVSKAKVKWVADQNLHVTLRFLGEVDDSKLPGICQLVAEAAGEVEAFDFRVGEIVCVPPAGPLRMFWADVAEPTGRMSLLYENISLLLEAEGYPSESRPFRPHITLGRVKFDHSAGQLRRQVAQFAGRDFGRVHGDSVTVYGSILTPSGPQYSVIDRVPLG